VNLITLLGHLKFDVSMTEHPMSFLLWKEAELENEYVPFYWGGYNQIFNNENLDRYFEGLMTYEEILQTVNLATMELPYKEKFIPLIKERLEEIKKLPEPELTKDQFYVLSALVHSESQFFSLTYLGKSVHKDSLVTMLALTQWNFWFQSISGWGIGYTALTLQVSSIFDIHELEIYLPVKEMKALIHKLPKLKTETTMLELDHTNTSRTEENKEKLVRLVDYMV